MATIPILEVISFSHEHSVHKVSNLIKGCGKWTIPKKNLSVTSRNEEISDLEVEFKLPPCSIEALEIGNHWTAMLTIEIGRCGESVASMKPLLKTSQIMFMTKLDCRTETNMEMMKFYHKSDINPEVLNSSKPWTRLRLVCKQPHRNDVYFGLSLLKIRGKRLDLPAPNPLHEKNLNDNSLISNDDVKVKVIGGKNDNNSNQQHPDWFVPESRASKMLEKSMKTKNFKFRDISSENAKVQKENSVTPPTIIKLRDEDDLTDQQPTASWSSEKKVNRNKILEDRINENASSSTSSQPKKFQFKKIDRNSSPPKRTKIVIEKPTDFLNYSNDQIKSIGILVQERIYKKPRPLPLKQGKELQVKAGQKIVFYKMGKRILINTEGSIYKPQVDPEHVRSIFKDYSEDEVFASDFTEFPTEPTTTTSMSTSGSKSNQNANTDPTEKCPLCEIALPLDELGKWLAKQ